MRIRMLAAAATLVVAACASHEPTDDHSRHSMPEADAAAAVPQDPNLPPDGSVALARLNSSPRHGEWVMIPTATDSIRAWIVYPERATAAPVVLVVHEIMGLSHWIRSVADQLAKEGFIAIAPDLITSANVATGPDGDPIRDQATAEIRSLTPAVYQPQLAAIAAWGMKLPSAAQRYGIVGFCWGGSASFLHSVMAPGVDAAVVYYGGAPAAEQIADVHAPVLGLYGGADNRINAGIPAADSAMKRFGKSYEYHIFDNAGHGFLRQQAERDGANLTATRQAWPRTVAFFRQHLEP